MDIDSPAYPPPKRRRTDSPTSGSQSDSPPKEHDSHDIPIRRNGTHPHSGSLSRSPTPRRARGARDRSGDSTEDEEVYGTPRSRYRSQTRTHSRSRSRSRSHGRSETRSRSESYEPPSPRRYGSRSVSPALDKDVDMKTDTVTKTQQKNLNFIPLATLSKAHARGITVAKFSPDGRLLATASADSTIKIWTVPALPPAQSSSPDATIASTVPTEWKLLRTLRAHIAGVNAICWSPLHDPGVSYTLATASDDKTVLLWQPLSSDFPVSPSPLIGHSNYVFSLSFSPKGNMLVTGSHDEAVFLYNVRNGTIMRKLPAHSDPVSGVDFVCDGSMVASCSWDGLIRIWDSGTGQCLRTLVDEDRKGVVDVKWCPNGSGVVGWGIDGGIRLWRVGEGRCVKTYVGHHRGTKRDMEHGVGGCIGRYLTSDGTKVKEEACILSGSEHGEVWIWDVVSKQVLWKTPAAEAHSDIVLGVDWCRPKDGDGRGLLVSVGKDRDVKIWIEDISQDVVDRWRKREEMGHTASGDVGGYAVEDDDEEDLNALEDQGPDLVDADVNMVNGGT